MKKLMLIVVGLFFVSAAFAEDTAGVLKKMKARDAKMESMAKDVTLTMDSKIVAEGMEMKNTMQVIMKGKKKMTEVSMMGMKTIVVNNGTEIWMVGAQQGKKKLNDENEAGQTPFGWADNMKAESLKLTEETVNDKKCFVLDGQDKKGNQGKWFIDKASLALVKYETKQNGKNMVLMNSDFKKVKGEIEMPYKMEFTTDGKPTMTSVIKSIELDKGVKDEIFNVDSIKQEELGKMDMEQMMKMMKR